MVIRRRITDPYGSTEDEFQRFRKEGPPKAPPRKPSLEEREPFVRALKRVPMNAVMDRPTFFRSVVDYYAQRKFTVWGQTLYIYPRYQHLTDNRVKCTGAMVGRLNPDTRNRRATMILAEDDQLVWYGRVIYWIAETVYG